MIEIKSLIITWKSDVSNRMVEHKGSSGSRFYKENNVLGLTSRSQRESFKNIKSFPAALKIVNKRNKKKMLFATWGKELIFQAPKNEA